MNRLAGASSAYLRAARDQPVDWHPWGDEAFAAARAADRPVLLDIGAAWCHWCHVMDHESYEDAALAEFLNRHFVCIKVDRDERPDVDARYQRGVQLLTGQGGWPLTAILDPAGEVLFGGTYFPPDDRWGRPGFRTVLERVLALWRERRPALHGPAAAVRRAVEEAGDRAQPGDAGPALLLAAERQMLGAYDAAYGGFGREPKFPHPTALRFLLRRWADGGTSRLRHAVLDTLHAMGRGGIHDQLGGGFHRYSVDRRWIIPHFEKMASDNAELLSACGEAGAAFGDSLCLEAGRGILHWVRDTLAEPGGGYGASQDADRGPGDDGSYFTWTRDEMAAVLEGRTLDLALRHYGIGTVGAMPHDPARHVLFVARDAAELAADTGLDPAELEAHLARARVALRAARAARRPPAVDRTRYTSWNAMMAAAVLRAAPVLEDSRAEAHALATLAGLAGSPEARPVRLPHAPGGVVGLLEDQVHAAEAALEAFEATGVASWLEWAVGLMDAAWEAHADPGRGGLFDRERGAEGPGLLGVGVKPIEDAPNPSPNGIAALVCARLAAHTGEERWRARHRALVHAFGGSTPGLHVATWLLAADWLVHPPVLLAVTGPAGDGVAEAMYRRARAAWAPRRVIRRLLPGVEAPGLPPDLRAMLRGPGARGYVCAGERCLEPAADPATWETRLREAVRGPGE